MTDTAPEKTTVTITVDGREIEAEPGELVIAAAERHGTYIPRFCYHSRMQPVGMCRMCVVEIDTGRGPALQPACMLPVADGMKVDTESAVTKKAQDGVLEFLLTNHPLDCPVCDKGGECPLQDHTMAFGPGESRFVEEKRHYEKPIPISDLVDLDRERCILCDRCTRFAKDVAGDPLIHFIDRGSQTQVNTFPDHEFASYFSGNTVQICPVGALTSSAYRFKARPWDLETTESTCTTCSVGCRMTIDASRNRVLRYNGVDIDPVNWGWLCDRGRYDFESVHSDDRLGEPLLRRGDSLQPAGWAPALKAAADAIQAAGSPDRVAVIGGARLTNEDAYAWAKLAKGVIGTDNVDAQLGDGLPAEVVLGLPRATIDQVCEPGGTVLLLGPQLKEELPVLHLRLRHAVRYDGVKVVDLTSLLGPNAEMAQVSILHRPGDTATTVRALLGAGPRPDGADGAAFDRATELLSGGFTVVLGRGDVATGTDDLVDAAGAVLDARPDTRFLTALRRGNVHGALDMGLAPGVLPGRVGLDEARDWFTDAGWASVPSARGLDTAGILQAAADGRIDVLVLLGADPLADFPDRDLAARGLDGARTIVALDQFLTRSSEQADVVLPVAGFAEVTGSTTNLEGRVSALGRIVTPPGTARSDWMIATEIARRLGSDLGLESPEEIWEEIERVAASHAGITVDLLAKTGVREGVVAPLGTEPDDAGPSGHPGSGVTEDAASAAVDAQNAESGEEQAAAEVEATESQADQAAAEAQSDEPETDSATPSGPQRPALVRFERGSTRPVPPADAYSLRLVATRKLYDAATLTQKSPSLAHLAQPFGIRLNPYDFDRLGVAAGAQVAVSSSRGSVSLPATADAAVPRGAAVVVVNQPGAAPEALVDASGVVTEIRVESNGAKK